MSYRYGWSEMQVGLVLAGVGVCSMIVQGLMVKPVVARLGERRAMVVGLMFGDARVRLLWIGGQRMVVSRGRTGDGPLGICEPGGDLAS